MPLPDYFCLDYPYDNQGYAFFAEDENGQWLNANSPASYDDYLCWLSTYLMCLQLEPRADQLRWWKDHATHTPDAAMRALGSELGIQDAVECLSRHSPIDCAEVSAECDWEWPHDVVPPIDLGYRILLAQILKLVEAPDERILLLDTFFANYWDYSNK